jgi:hypothetical protein
MADMMPMYFTDKQLLSMLEAFAKLVAEHEREACAQVAFSWNTALTALAAEEIRARGEA